ncbi:hypothetical protein [Saccharothrix deserti]|uniref:hypothetical protein n=1 Tax=Saccharothrix deserti TaxID=2593674 RepID=UPI00131D944C|nr:hypothetical protein [Saccharothrix deserti]
MFDTQVIAAFALRDPYAEAVVWLAVQNNDVIIVPALALSAALTRIPPASVSQDAHDALAVLLSLAEVDVVDAARSYGLADVRAHADNPDDMARDPELLVAAHVVSVAADHDFPVVTDDMARIHALDPRREVKLPWRRPPRA